MTIERCRFLILRTSLFIWKSRHIPKIVRAVNKTKNWERLCEGTVFFSLLYRISRTNSYSTLSVKRIRPEFQIGIMSFCVWIRNCTIRHFDPRSSTITFQLYRACIQLGNLNIVRINTFLEVRHLFGTLAVLYPNDIYEPGKHRVPPSSKRVRYRATITPDTQRNAAFVRYFVDKY